MIEMIQWIGGSTEAAFLSGTVLYAACFAGSQVFSKFAAGAQSPHQHQIQAQRQARVAA